MRKTPLLIGLALLLVGSAVIVLALGSSSSGAKHAPSAPVALSTVNCIGGSEKQALMADPRLRQILASKYHLQVNFTPEGSYDQVQMPTAQLKAQHVDCLWPSSSSAQQVFEKLHSTADFPDYSAQTTLESPEVLYSGPQSTAALQRAGIVKQQGGQYFVVDMRRLLLDEVLKGKTWASLGASSIDRPITIFSTDPATSNSGFTMSQLELIEAASPSAYQEPTLQQAKAALGTVHALYAAQGLQAASSASGFEQWLSQGAEEFAPLYAGYENQIIQQTVASAADPAVLAQLKSQVRILYPQPTIYADHPILALSAAGAAFQKAMADPQIQELAWRSYGFRSTQLLGIDNVSDFPALPLASSLQSIDAPNADVTLALLACIQHDQCS